MSVSGIKPVMLILAENEEEAKAVENTMQHLEQEYEIKVATNNRMERINEIKEADVCVVACDLKNGSDNLSKWKEEVEKYNSDPKMIVVGVMDEVVGVMDESSNSDYFKQRAKAESLDYLIIDQNASPGQQRKDAESISIKATELLLQDEPEDNFVIDQQASPVQQKSEAENISKEASLLDDEFFKPPKKPKEEIPEVRVSTYNFTPGAFWGAIKDTTKKTWAIGADLVKGLWSKASQAFSGPGRGGESSGEKKEEQLPKGWVSGDVKANKGDRKVTVSQRADGPNPEAKSDRVSEEALNRSRAATYTPASKAFEEEHKIDKGKESKVEERKATKPRSNTM